MAPHAFLPMDDGWLLQVFVTGDDDGQWWWDPGLGTVTLTFCQRGWPPLQEPSGQGTTCE